MPKDISQNSTKVIGVEPSTNDNMIGAVETKKKSSDIELTSSDDDSISTHAVYEVDNMVRDKEGSTSLQVVFGCLR